MPSSLAAIWARRSARLVAGAREGYMAVSRRSMVSASFRRPFSTSSQLSISTPSSSTRVLALGIDPGEIPPISA
jgi:hypothetical protein